MKLEEMTEILGKKAILFSNFKLMPTTIKAWFDHFRSVSKQEFEPAITAAINEPGRAFFPSPGEITRYLNATKPQLPDAGEVWSKLLTLAASRGNPWAYLENNLAGQTALRHVGWDSIKFSDIEKELPFRKREFIQVYNQAIESQGMRERAFEAIGTTEAKHVLNGFTRQLLEAKQ